MWQTRLVEIDSVEESHAATSMLEEAKQHAPLEGRTGEHKLVLRLEVKS
jgi:hypothetical protein